MVVYLLSFAVPAATIAPVRNALLLVRRGATDVRIDALHVRLLGGSGGRGIGVTKHDGWIMRKSKA